MLSLAAKLALSPLLAAQALYVMRTAQLLPEPEGPRSGTAGSGPKHRLLILGDSSVAGVGASHQSQALSGQLPPLLVPHLALEWQLIARTGATSKSTLRTLENLPEQRFDTAFVGLGVNDVTRLTSPSTWLKQQHALHALLHGKFGVKRILRSGLPPMHRFPLLPQPLRYVLGRDAKRLDTLLAKLCAADSALIHIPLNLPFEPRYVAADGYHPSEAAYAKWAQIIAQHLRP
ncbi:SGNH/GDSL hydrolase family protein [Lentibacter algarum]|uniref:SGNH/GDSL hydrolase family protein n=1 Tax=Lentibacter algarum TaxID=576131 RepID=UPI001C07B65A|nr:SGNH/GDSL hydrolase family protein [Lentibacter algarum]MBU2980949.1 SGNH/GDSL hydrolase family protein [Lentibacter algarum]